MFQMIADKDMGGGGNERRGRGGDRGHFGGGPPGMQNNYNNDFDNNGQQGGGVIEVIENLNLSFMFTLFDHFYKKLCSFRYSYLEQQ